MICHVGFKCLIINFQEQRKQPLKYQSLGIAPLKICQYLFKLRTISTIKTLINYSCINGDSPSFENIVSCTSSSKKNPLTILAKNRKAILCFVLVIASYANSTSKAVNYFCKKQKNHLSFCFGYREIASSNRKEMFSKLSLRCHQYKKFVTINYLPKNDSKPNRNSYLVDTRRSYLP